MLTDLEIQIIDIAKRAHKARLSMANLTTAVKNAVLASMAEFLVSETATIVSENAKDVSAGVASGLSPALVDRLTLTPARILAMAEGVRQTMALPDPVGEFLERTERPNGLRIEKVRVPMGVVGIIYESRPNVTIDCAVLCLKSGNACILRGGKEALHSNQILGKIIRSALKARGVPEDAVCLIPTVDREALTVLLRQEQWVHCIIPRGGESLIRFVTEHSRIPVIKHYKGVCSVFLDESASAEKAESIVVNAKCQRPGVCNAVENLWIHDSLPASVSERVLRALVREKVELRVAEKDLNWVQGLVKDGVVKVAEESDFYEEYLALIIAVGRVQNVDTAIEMANRYGSGHSDAIITENEGNARRFLKEVDSATVYWNASTRFTDGFEFGLGAEIGISTDRLHARGPMGLRELCTYKFQIVGTGQIRK